MKERRAEKEDKTLKYIIKLLEMGKERVTKATIDMSKCDAKRDRKALAVRIDLQELEHMKRQIKKEKEEEKKKGGGKVKDESKEREEGKKKARKTRKPEDIDREKIRAKDEPDWYEMSPKEEQGKLEEMRKEQRAARRRQKKAENRRSGGNHEESCGTVTTGVQVK